MIERVNPLRVLADHFCPFRVAGGRRFSWTRLLWFTLVPGIATVICLWRFSSIAKESGVNVLTAFGIIGAVLAGLLPVVHAVVGAIPTDRKFEPGEVLASRNLRQRVEVLRELYAVICYSVLVLVVGIVAGVVIASDVDHAARCWASGFVFFVAASTVISFLDVLLGIYSALDEEGEEAAKKIAANTTSESRLSKDSITNRSTNHQ